MKSRAVTIVCLSFMTMLLSACGSSDHTLHFKKELVLNYGSSKNAISLIESVGNTKVKSSNIKDNVLEIDNFVVTCDKVDTNKLDTYKVTYKTSDAENRLFTKNVIVKDISAPVIKLKKKVLEMTLSEYNSFNFADFISVVDNWKEEEPAVNIEIDGTVKEGGSYKVSISAKDKFGNESNSTFTLKIKKSEEEKPKETTKEPEYTPPVTPPSVPQTNGNSGNTPPVVQPTEPEPPATNNVEETPTPVPTPSNRDFLFSDGYTMENVSGACQAALNSSGASGSCNPITGSDGLYIGMRLTFN